MNNLPSLKYYYPSGKTFKLTRILQVFLITVIMFSSAKLWSQDNTLYMMRGIHQSLMLNPAFQDNYGFVFSFPGLASFKTDLDFRDFNPNDVVFNLNNLESVLKNQNRIDFSIDHEILSIGFVTGKSGITFDISHKFSSQISIPKDMIVLWRKGNADYAGKTMNLNNWNISMNWYIEYALGYSYKVNKNLTLGVRFKYLNGIANITPKLWNASMYTYPDTFDIHLQSDLQMQVSGPINITYKNGTDELDSVKYIDRNLNQLVNRYLLYNPNAGYGLDLGATWTLNEKWMFSASLTDLGYIAWKKDIYEFTQKSDFTYHGIDLTYNNANDTIMDNSQDLIDSVKHMAKIHGTNNAYTSYLVPKLCMGASYRIFPHLTLGALSKTIFYSDGTTTAITFSGNTEILKFLSASLSYTMINYSPANIGLGLGFRAGPLQIYLLSDNVIGWRYDGNNNIIWPAYTREFGLRFGVNFLFSRLEEKPEAGKTKGYRHHNE
ncbi:MAG: DUF5723 family protein [Bacteroidia bacterium]|nr:DUF5723 family protein [Bacteroidia bacterium]